MTIETKYNFMTEQEVLDRMRCGEDALELSIEKWDRIVDAFRLHQHIFIREFACAGTCALCWKYVVIDEPCLHCPYYRVYGSRCDHSGHAWHIFAHYPSIKTAWAMRSALRGLRGR